MTKMLRTTLRLGKRQAALIDRARADMRLRHRVAISRSAVIGALIDLAETKDTMAVASRSRRAK
jgi:hypothetical protein